MPAAASRAYVGTALGPLCPEIADRRAQTVPHARMGGARLRYRHLIACRPAASHCRRAAFIPGRYAGRCSCTYKRDAGATLAVPVGEGPLPQSSATLCPKRRAPHLHHPALSSARAWPLDRFKRVPPRHYQATTDAIEIASAGGHSLGITDACHGAHGAKTIGSQPRIGTCALKPEAAIARRCQRRYCFADRYRKHRCRCLIGAESGDSKGQAPLPILAPRRIYPLAASSTSRQQGN